MITIKQLPLDGPPQQEVQINTIFGIGSSHSERLWSNSELGTELPVLSARLRGSDSSKPNRRQHYPQLKRSTCSNHHAVNAEHSLKGLAATGIGAIDCGRHVMKRPQAVGDLLSGIALPHSDISLKGISYKSIYHVMHVFC